MYLSNTWTPHSSFSACWPPFQVLHVHRTKCYLAHLWLAYFTGYNVLNMLAFSLSVEFPLILRVPFTHAHPLILHPHLSLSRHFASSDILAVVMNGLTVRMHLSFHFGSFGRKDPIVEFPTSPLTPLKHHTGHEVHLHLPLSGDRRFEHLSLWATCLSSLCACMWVRVTCIWKSEDTL